MITLVFSRLGLRKSYGCSDSVNYSLYTLHFLYEQDAKYKLTDNLVYNSVQNFQFIQHLMNCVAKCNVLSSAK